MTLLVFVCQQPVEAYSRSLAKRLLKELGTCLELERASQDIALSMDGVVDAFLREERPTSG